MFSIGHPLVGDPLYGFKKSKYRQDGQMLHAKTLGFIHPRTKEYMEFSSELPYILKKCWKNFKSEVGIGRVSFMNLKANLLDDKAIKRSLIGQVISHEIIERNKGVEDIVLVGIKEGGVLFLGFGVEINNIEGINVPLGSVDITFYRDDLTLTGDSPKVKNIDLGVNIHNKKVDC